MTPLLSDARLARQATSGDQRAFAAIYKRYHQGLYRFCLSILGRPEDAQDALQNTMVKALRSLPGEQREIQLKPWLYRVAHNESIDLLRKRREGPALNPAQVSRADEITETVALRERLGRLLGDLGELPERQRSVLVMRELAGLDYQQIGEAFESSAAVARQTIYEARLNLRELEAGREMGCEKVTRQLSEADGRVTRRRDIQAHMRNCAECRAFRDSIESRRQDLAALSPLPAALGASILSGLAGGQAATSAGGGAAAAAGAGAGKIAASSVALKTMATVAVVATVGVTAADRGGLIDAGLPGGSGDQAKPLEGQPQEPRPEPAARFPLRSATGLSEQAETGRRANLGRAAAIRQAQDKGRAGRGNSGSAPEPSRSSPGAAGGGSPGSATGPPTSLPDASRHGQETAAAHKASGSENPGRGQRNTNQGNGQGSPKKTRPTRGSSGSRHSPPAHPGPPEHAKNGATGQEKGQPSKSPPPAPTEADAPPAQPKGPSGDSAEPGNPNGKPEPSS